MTDKLSSMGGLDEILAMVMTKYPRKRTRTTKRSSTEQRPGEVICFPSRPGHFERVAASYDLGHVPTDLNGLRSWYADCRRRLQLAWIENEALRKELHSMRLSRAYWRRKADRLDVSAAE
jgi:hypothetical protein